MEEIKWLEVAVSTTPDRLDQVCAKLAAAGMDSLVIEDEQDFLNFLEQNRQYWDYVDQELLDRMQAYFEQRREIAVDLKVRPPETAAVAITVQVAAGEGRE